MKFFVPGEEDAEATLERMSEACGAWEDTRPVYPMSYDHDGSEVAATVGEGGVVAIIFGSAFYIFEAAGNPRSVPFGASRGCFSMTSES